MGSYHRDLVSAIHLSARRVVGGDCRHVDDVGILDAHRDDLDRLVETDQQRADDGGAAKFLQHLGRDRGRVKPGQQASTRRLCDGRSIAPVSRQSSIGRLLSDRLASVRDGNSMTVLIQIMACMKGA